MCSRDKAHNPACTHATRATTAATERIGLTTNWGRVADPRTRPLGSTSLGLLRCSVARYQVSDQVIPAHGKFLSCTWPRKVFRLSNAFTWKLFRRKRLAASRQPGG